MPASPRGEKVNTFTAVSNGWDNLSGLHANLLSVALLEFVLTAVFVPVILGVTDRRAPSGFAPLAIGVTLSLAHLIAIPVSNASLNPARSIATAVWGGQDALAQLWLFIVVPLVAGAVGGLLYKPLLARR